jgi:hypothetical protein
MQGGRDERLDDICTCAGYPCEGNLVAADALVVVKTAGELSSLSMLFWRLKHPL